MECARTLLLAMKFPMVSTTTTFQKRTTFQKITKNVISTYPERKCDVDNDNMYAAQECGGYGTDCVCYNKFGVLQDISYHHIRYHILDMSYELEVQH